MPIRQDDFRSRAYPFARAEHDPPIVACILFHQQHFNLSGTARFGRAQSGGDYSRVVQNHYVAAPQVLWEVTKSSVRNATLGTLQHQQSGLVAFRHRFLSDQFGRQGVVEIGCAHDPCLIIRGSEARQVTAR